MRQIYHTALQGRTGHDAGRALLAQAYQEQFGRSLPEIAVTSRGKPYFVGNDWDFSITHTKRHAFCVLSDRPVGIDAEELDRKLSPRLAEKILSPRELARYQKAADPNRALLALWVLKEAAAKRSGEGLQGYPRYTDFDPEDPRVIELDGCLVAVLEQEADHAV